MADLKKLVNIAGGIERPTQHTIRIGAYERVVGGRVAMGRQRSAIERECDANQITDVVPTNTLVEKYGLRKDYHKALSILWGKLHSESVVSPREESELLREICQALEDRLDLRHVPMQLVPRPDPPIGDYTEDELAPHMEALEQYYTEVTRQLQKIIEAA